MMKRIMAETMKQFSLPRYEQLPDMGLYLEQTVKYVNQLFAPLDCVEITGSMVRNYVKMGLIENPVKKQYYAQHVAYIIAVTLLKQVVPLDRILTLFTRQKLVYSTQFGFSVCKAQKLLKDGAYDNMLALSEDGDTYHPRYGCEEYEVTETSVISVWKPFAGVTVRTTVTPMGEWHLREHEITTDRALYAAEGGFAIARGRNGEVETLESADCTAVIAPWGAAGVRNVEGYTGGTVVMPEPNTNLMAPRTLIPTPTPTNSAPATAAVSGASARAGHSGSNCSNTA